MSAIAISVGLPIAEARSLRAASDDNSEQVEERLIGTRPQDDRLLLLRAAVGAIYQAAFVELTAVVSPASK